MVIPAPDGKLDGLAVRVPLEDRSPTDLTVRLDSSVTAARVDRVFQDAAEGRSRSSAGTTTSGRYANRTIDLADLVARTLPWTGPTAGRRR